VPRDRVFVRDEDIGDGERVAPCALEPAHVPHVHDLRLVGGEEQGSLDDLTRTVSPKRSVGLADGRVPTEPRGAAAAAGQSPQPGEAIAAFDGDGAGVRTPGP